MVGSHASSLFNAFVFIYPDADPAAAVAAREADAADVDPATLELSSRTAERPLNDGLDTHVFEASNVIVVLAGGDDELGGLRVTGEGTGQGVLARAGAEKQDLHGLSLDDGNRITSGIAGTARPRPEDISDRRTNHGPVSPE